MRTILLAFKNVAVGEEFFSPDCGESFLKRTDDTAEMIPGVLSDPENHEIDEFAPDEEVSIEVEVMKVESLKLYEPAATALALRQQALALLVQAKELDGLDPYLVTHTHRFGASTYVLWHSETPTIEQAEACLDSQFEPDIGETLEIDDPLTLEEMTGAIHDSHIVDTGSDDEADAPASPGSA
jgi:hypothetical protein